MCKSLSDEGMSERKQDKLRIKNEENQTNAN